MKYFSTRDLDVGYDGEVLIHDIAVEIEKGKILTLIGPNGAGKSTILKSITRQIEKIRGTISIENKEIYEWKPREMAMRMAVVLTDRVNPELMTCEELVAMGRYPYTDALGRMTPADQEIVNESLRRVHAEELAHRDVSTLSDGQRQRIMLARAICQEPEVIVLDEPTAYLDIRHKIELLDILREMAHERGITVIMSLHEIDLATKISDYLLCVKGDTIAAFGPPEEIFQSDAIDRLYDIKHGSYNLLFGSVELTKPEGEPEVFVVAGGGRGIPCYRALQKRQVPFATGVLFDNDVDCQVAMELSGNVHYSAAFEPMSEQAIAEAEKAMLRCKAVIDAGTHVGAFNRCNELLLKKARQEKIPVYDGWKSWAEAFDWG